MKEFNKSFSASILLIVALIVLGYFLLRNDSRDTSKEEVLTEEPGETKDTTPKLIDLSLVQEKTYREPDQYATFDVTYPSFENASSEFNEKIESVVMEAVAVHKEDSANNWQARYETKLSGDDISEFPASSEKYTFSLDWKPAQVNNDSISFILVASGYTGGAHGYESMVSSNYDVEKRREIALAEFFPSGSNYLKTLSLFSRKDLETQFRTKLKIKTADEEKYFDDSLIPMIEMGTTPEEMNFSIFTFTPNAITLYFLPYQVAPYSMGSSTVVFPRK